MISQPVISMSDLDTRTARKTKPVEAKPLSAIVADLPVLEHLQLTTLEGPQRLRQDAWLCRGRNGEFWQQTHEKLMEKYHSTGTDAEGWTTFVPRPDNAVNAAQANGHREGFAVRGQWGQEQPNGDFLQYGEDGDYVLQSRNDPDDVWVVKRDLFEATYDYSM